MCTACQEAILDRDLGVQFADQEQADGQQQQRDGHSGKTLGLPVGGLFIVLDRPGTLLLHDGQQSTAE